MSQKIYIIIIAIFLLIVGFGFAWAGINVEDVLSFDLAQDDMILFDPPEALTPYSLGINSSGDFIIEQNSVEKFRITSSGDIYMAGSITEGTIPWTSVSPPTDCAGGTFLTGIDVNGDLTCSAP